MVDMKNRKKYIRLAVIAVPIVALDQITKVAVTMLIPLYHSIPVIPGFFNLTHVLNPGGAFGILASQSSTIRILVFLLISSLAICFVLYFYLNTPETHFFLSIGFAMIFGGAIGNIIDRVRFGMVVDFLDVYVKNSHWPAFNVADSAICVGMVVFVYHVLFKKMPE